MLVYQRVNLTTLGLEGPEPAPKHREMYPLLITRGWLEELQLTKLYIYKYIY